MKSARSKRSVSVACALYALCQGSLLFALPFNSLLKLKIYKRGSGDIPDTVIGFTPATRSHPISVPVEKLWYVRPIGLMSTAALDELAKEVRHHKIPGLDLSDHWELTSASLSRFQGITTLRMLDLSRTRISDSGMHYFRALRALRILVLPEAVTNLGLVELKYLPNLNDLNLDRTRLSTAGMVTVGSLSTLERLDLSGTGVVDEDLEPLKKLHRLKHLVLNSRITDAGAPTVRALRSLQEVDLSQTQMTDAGLLAIAGLPRLNRVFLNKQVGDVGLKNLSMSKSLKTLDLTGAQITSRGVAALAELKSLQELSLSETPVGNECLPSLARLEDLRMLDLSDTQVTSEGLEPLARLHKLEVIALSWKTMSREDLQGLAKLARLNTIILNGVPLSESTMVQLRHIRQLSPWDTPSGIERANLRRSDDHRELALAAPVKLSAPTSTASHFAEAPNGDLTRAKTFSPLGNPDGISAGPASPRSWMGKLFKPTRVAPSPSLLVHHDLSPEIPDPERIGIHASTATSAPILAAKHLKDSGRALPSSLSQKSVLSGSAENADLEASKPALASHTSKKDEDQLLKVITLLSHPSKGGAFSGLAGMKQARSIDTRTPLSDISADPKQKSIRMQEDRPEDSVGEFNINSKHR